MDAVDTSRTLTDEQLANRVLYNLDGKLRDSSTQTAPALTILIWTSANSLPSDFNIPKVNAQVNQILQAAGVSVQVKIGQTTKPAKWFVDLGWWQSDGPARRWINYLDFFPDTPHYTAYSNNGWTVIYPNQIHALGATSASADMTMVYSNILLHEVFWQGILNKSDNYLAESGTLESPNRTRNGNRNLPNLISPTQAKDINDACARKYK